MRTSKLNALVAIGLCLFATSLTVKAQTTSFACPNPPVKVIKDARTVLLKCSTAWSDPAALVVDVFESKEDLKTNPAEWIKPFPVKVAARRDPDIFTLTLTLDADMKPSTDYVFALRGPATAAAQADLIVKLSTQAKGKIIPSLAQLDLGRKFVVTSDVAFAPFGVQSQDCTPTSKSNADCTIQEKREEHATSSKPLDAEVQINAEVQNPAITSPPPESFGRASVTLKHNNRLTEEKPSLAVKGLRNAFGEPVAVENVVPLSAPPKGKDDAKQFYQLSHIGTKGEKPSLGINLKINAFGPFTSSFFLGDFLVQPDIQVDVATNSLAKTSADLIHLGVTGTNTWLTKDPGAFIQGASFGPGVTYETNRKFDKRNLLGTFELHPIFRGLYQTRELRRYKLIADECKRDQACFIKQLAETPQSVTKAGYGVELFFGLEAGGSLVDQLFQSKSKKSSVDIPTYSIVRFRPRLHAFYEYDRFTLDLSSTFRLLATPEYVGEAMDNDNVRLRRVAGFQPYNEVTLSYGLDQSKHTSLSITYKRGAQPPLYPHTNTVQSGFTIKY